MKTEDLIQVKKKIDSAKEKKARAEGAKAKIEEQWARDFQVNSLDGAKSKVAEIELAIKKDDAKLTTLLEELEKVTDWSKI